MGNAWRAGAAAYKPGPAQNPPASGPSFLMGGDIAAGGALVNWLPFKTANSPAVTGAFGTDSPWFPTQFGVEWGPPETGPGMYMTDTAATGLPANPSGAAYYPYSPAWNGGTGAALGVQSVFRNVYNELDLWTLQKNGSVWDLYNANWGQVYWGCSGSLGTPDAANSVSDLFAWFSVLAIDTAGNTWASVPMQAQNWGAGTAADTWNGFGQSNQQPSMVAYDSPNAPSSGTPQIQALAVEMGIEYYPGSGATIPIALDDMRLGPVVPGSGLVVGGALVQSLSGLVVPVQPKTFALSYPADGDYRIDLIYADTVTGEYSYVEGTAASGTLAYPSGPLPSPGSATAVPAWAVNLTTSSGGTQAYTLTDLRNMPGKAYLLDPPA